MARSSHDVAKCVHENTIQENEKRLREARIKSQGKGRIRQDLNRLLRKLNQAVEENSTKSSDKLNLSCYNRNVTSCWYGSIPKFPSGSWWGIRMDCSRDGVHNPFNADVDEGSFGAASVCTSQANMNEDVDFGDFLTLTGQVYHKEQLSTDPFIHNYKNQIPLRLIRSYNLQNDIAPNTGYRYDGLYIVIDYWIATNADGIQYNKFALMRLTDQESPNWSSKSSEVPSVTRHSTSARPNHHPKPPIITSNTYDLRKCSPSTDGKRKFNHRDNREALPVAKTIPSFDTKKSVPESSIVTRHVFKKPSNAESIICSTSVPDRKTLTCLGTSAPKTHSTNISIRMGLYESSHNAQEAKRNVTTMLHKPFKPIDIANRTALDIDVRSPPRKDPKPVARIDMDTTTRVNPQPVESATSCNGHVVASDNTMNKLDCSLSKRKKDDSCSRAVHPSGCSPYAASAPVDGSKNNVNGNECQQHSRDAGRVVNVPMSNSVDEPPRSPVTMRERISRSQDASKQSGEALHTQDIKSLESLTPDKILNLINKEKHHPLSKMLIGNVIGLTTEECAMWDAPKVNTPDASPKISHKQRDNTKENVVCLSEDMMLSRRYCRYRSKRLSWKVSKQTDAGKFDKALRRQSRNDVDQNRNRRTRMKDPSDGSKENNEYLSPFNVQSSLQTIAQHTRSAYDIKTRLRADKDVLTKQDFSSSPMKKNRLHKKGDREIANLLIDANIGPKMRGPRNRRLRCINNTYTNKRCYSTLNTIVYPPGKRNRITEKQRYKSNFKRKSKPTKVGRQPARDRQSKDRYRVLRSRSSTEDMNSTSKEESLGSAMKSNNDRGYNANTNEGSRKKENRSAAISNVSDCNVPKTSFDRSLRKKLVQTVPLSRRAPQTSRLYYFRKKPLEKPNTMDATTQCRLIFEGPAENSSERSVEGSKKPGFTSSGHSADRRIKLQPESVLDVVCNDQGSQVYTTTLRIATSALTTSDECHASSSGSTRRTLTEKDRTSAFVPVNTLDSDLRIARLRSIGFRPIIKPRSPLDEKRSVVQSERKHLLVSTSKVTKRDVAEEYDKYTNNEDNNVVVYMDDELQYQDIEEEDEGARTKSMEPTLVEVEGDDDIDDDDEDDDDNDEEQDVQSYDDNTVSPEMLVSRENLESPWHGWKKIVTNNRSYWIGW
ncbi:uncharacterized protein LOC105181060 [Harpegnathos saltator]|uniref:Histone-lysine N-methyltransferase, H3 lysine-9 specific SUVH6 n=1 Tax=Harpegnathos saltator TaxID=610380 RepID=E2BBR7_HARSA|nr:uncharacterized protein LOC105181060 [Harpegnathos saltator]EFN86843.1 Histone-lysine N-methyltransferase, H3 lysine-9 specific SUVH6 [Harpegnathos saltator]